MRELGELNRKLHGWRGTPRGLFLLLQKKILTKEEFLLYDASLSFADWDKNKSTYGSFNLTQQEIELLLGFTAGFVSKRIEKLCSLGLWQRRKDGRIQVIGFELIEIYFLKEITHKNLLVDPLTYFANLQISLTNSQNLIAKKQTDFPKDSVEIQSQDFANLQMKSSISDIVSYKDNNIRAPLVRTDKEYENIVKEGNYAVTTKENLRDIDEILGDAHDY